MKLDREALRKRLSEEWVGDGEAFLYYEARELIRHGQLEDLTADHWQAISSYQRTRLNIQPTGTGSIF